MIVCYGFVVKAQKMNCWKPFPQQTFLETSPQQNGFRVQHTETIFTAKWFWSTTHRNHFHCKMVLESNSQKPFSLQNGLCAGTYARCIRISLCTITRPVQKQLAICPFYHTLRVDKKSITNGKNPNMGQELWYSNKESN